MFKHRYSLMFFAIAMLFTACSTSENEMEPTAEEPVKKVVQKQPLVVVPSPMSREPTKSQDIKVIKDYYKLISDGNLEEAWHFHQPEKPTDLETFKRWYKDEYVSPVWYEDKYLEVDPHTYKFLVNVGFNDSYEVIMHVSDNTIQTLSSKHMVEPHSEITQDDLHAYSIGTNGYESLFVHKGDEKITVINTKVTKLPFEYDPIEFSPTGRYLIYRTSGLESGYYSLYDIINQKLVIDNIGGGYVGVDMKTTPNEKYAYFCTGGAEVFGKVYALPDGKEVFTVSEHLNLSGVSSLDCNIDTSGDSIVFTTNKGEATIFELQ